MDDTFKTDKTIKPCPFCGSPAELLHYKRNGLHIRCSNIPGCGFGLQQRVLRNSLEWLAEKMVERWNRRTPELKKEVDAFNMEVKIQLGTDWLKEFISLAERYQKALGRYPAQGQEESNEDYIKRRERFRDIGNGRD